MIEDLVSSALKMVHHENIVMLVKQDVRLNVLVSGQTLLSVTAIPDGLGVM